MVKGGKYYKGDSVAVLVSAGHGAGWSSWAHTEEQQKLAMFDPEIVQWILDGKPNNHLTLADPLHRGSYFTDKYGGTYFYDGNLFIPYFYPITIYNVNRAQWRIDMEHFMEYLMLFDL